MSSSIPLITARSSQKEDTKTLQNTLRLDRPFDNIVCLSSSYIGYLSAIGKDSVVSAVSGADYITNPLIRERCARGEVFDVGYDAALDFERIVALRPDLVLTYTVSQADPGYISRLRDLGIRVMVLGEHLESHPLARAEYVRLFGALTGVEARADSLFGKVCERYDSLACPSASPVGVLVNTPFAGVWYIPGGDNYISRLVRDAGGEVLGAVPGAVTSGTISLEKALVLSGEAAFWINTGTYDTRRELLEGNPSLSNFDVPHIFNNTKRATPGGGNDFWESGPVHPDVVLDDLRKIFSHRADSLVYYKPVL